MIKYQVAICIGPGRDVFAVLFIVLSYIICYMLGRDIVDFFYYFIFSIHAHLQKIATNVFFGRTNIDYTIIKFYFENMKLNHYLNKNVDAFFVGYENDVWMSIFAHIIIIIHEEQ